MGSTKNKKIEIDTLAISEAILIEMVNNHNINLLEFLKQAKKDVELTKYLPVINT